jgi:hypothetical protein
MRSLVAILIATTACVKSGQVVDTRPVPQKTFDLRQLCTSQHKDLCQPVRQDEMPVKIDTNLATPTRAAMRLS